MTIDPTQTVDILRALGVGVASLVLILVGIVAIFGPGRKGNSSGAFRILGATLVGLIPLVIGVSIGAVAFGAAFLGWAVPGLTT